MKNQIIEEITITMPKNYFAFFLVDNFPFKYCPV